MIRYYCSGFDINNAFGHGLGDMFKEELNQTKSIVYVPGSPQKIEKAKAKYIPSFRNHFKNVGIEFENEYLISPEMDKNYAKSIIEHADFIMLMGGNPFLQKEMCEKLEIMEILKNYNGVMLGFSAGAMLMSKFVIITPCSEEYPSFRVENGLNLDNISVYPHNNTCNETYPDILDIGTEKYAKNDLIKVASEYGDFYLLQDYLNEKGKTDVSIIKSINGSLEFYIENNGKIWKATPDGINIINGYQKIKK